MLQKHLLRGPQRVGLGGPTRAQLEAALLMARPERGSRRQELYAKGIGHTVYRRRSVALSQELEYRAMICCWQSHLAMKSLRATACWNVS